MDFFDFFFPQQAQATYLRRIASMPGATGYRPGVDREDLVELQRENRELRLYLSAVLQVLVEKGLLKPADVQAKILSLLPPLPEAPTEAGEENPFANVTFE
jgi:hypothetical protein